VAISLRHEVSRRFLSCISWIRGRYSVRDRATIEGVPADRRSESLVVKSGCDETCTLEAIADGTAEEGASGRAVIWVNSVVLS